MHEMASLQVMDEIYDKEENEYIQENRDNILGLYLVFYRHSYLNYERLKLKFDMLSEEMKHTPEGQVIDKRYKKLSEVKVGAYAPNFKLPTLDGDSVHLYGKSATIKIIDFWASWCGPCRKENPHLVEIYKKYKDKDLLMISVSMDTDENAWRKDTMVKRSNYQMFTKNTNSFLSTFGLLGVEPAGQPCPLLKRYIQTITKKASKLSVYRWMIMKKLGRKPTRKKKFLG